MEFELRTGDVLVFYTPFKISDPMTWLAALIRLGAKTHYNHAGIIVNSWGVPYVVESNHRGVIITPAERRLVGKHYKVLRPDAPTLEVCGYKTESDLARSITDKLGMPYDFKALLIEQVLLQLFGIWVGSSHETASQAKSFYCYELVANIYKEVFPQWYKISPNQLLNSHSLKEVFEKN